MNVDNLQRKYYIIFCRHRMKMKRALLSSWKQFLTLELHLRSSLTPELI